ncbi:AAA family ATPase [Serratia marcescens]
MIKSISGKNYKAFKEFNLELAPLTVLLGANSCGKSSLIHLLLMLSQTAGSINKTESVLRLNGSKVGMGDAINIIKDKKEDGVIEISIELDSSEKNRFTHISHYRSVISESFYALSRSLPATYKNNKETFNQINKTCEEFNNLYMDNNIFDSKNVKKSAGLIIDMIRYCRSNSPIENENEQYESRFNGFYNRAYELIMHSTYQKIEDVFYQVGSLSDDVYNHKKLTYRIGFDSKKSCLRLFGLEIINNAENSLFKIEEVNKKWKITSSILNNDILRRSSGDIFKRLNLESFNLSKNVDDDSYIYGFMTSFLTSRNPLAHIISQMIITSASYLCSEINGNNINHVSPLRAFPQRYYLLDKAINHTALNALDGAELAEILKNNPKILKNINNLFNEFKIHIDIKKVNDIIHTIRVNQEAVDLELTDVGFGISQVLPILVQAYLSPKETVTIIEQPEIHLHPKMQAWLTDALINIALKENKKFLIETHSEALIRRIRLRIVDENSKLDKTMVRIYHLERDRLKLNTKIEKIEILDDGDIKWPSDFMDVEIEDTLKIQEMKYKKYLTNKSKGVH